MRHAIPFACLFVSAAALAQKGSAAKGAVVLAPGLTLPVQLGHEIAAGGTKPGTAIRVKTTQRVPLTDSSFLKPGTEILGTVVASQAANGAQPASLTLRFTALRAGSQTVPIRTGALAAASFLAVAEAGTPCAGAVDRANPDPANWTTCQVGGEEVARSGWQGTVIDSVTHTVGFADFHGVYANPATPGAPPHALGVFASTAHGAYGYGPDATLSAAEGTMTLTAPDRMVLHGEDNLLLQVIAP